MKRILSHAVPLLFLSIALATGDGSADESPRVEPGPAPVKPPNAQKESKRNWYPFGGIVVAANKEAGTISLKKKAGERILRVNSRSKLEIDGRAAGLGSVRVGNYAHGRLQKDSTGNEMILNATFDPEPPNKRKEPQSPRKTPDAKAGQ